MPSTTGAFSGKDGKVMIGATDLAHITSWSFNPVSNNPSWASSSTAGFKARVAGIRDGSGTIEGKYDKTDPIDDRIREGDCVTLLLFQDATRKFTVPAIIDGMSFEQDMDDGDVVTWSADFSSTGAFTYPGE